MIPDFLNIFAKNTAIKSVNLQNITILLIHKIFLFLLMIYAKLSYQYMYKPIFLKSVLLAIIFTAIVSISWGQDGKVEGNLYSSITKEKITDAAVSLYTKNFNTKYSSLTDSTGHFSFKNVPSGNYYLSFKALSFKSIQKPVSLVRLKNNLELDSIFMTPTFESLQSVTVVAKKATAIIKTDTMIFNAAAFRVRKNGTVEDLFKKIPGMEVDKNSGAVKAQGETITQIYVDGKPFFGTDIKSITQNFPAEVIDKIEIIDKKSDQAIATKIEDGIREKIINVVLKKNSKRGLFGKNYIAAGTNGRYEGKINTNIFNNDKKIAIVAGANNTGRTDNNNSGSNDASYNSNGINDNKQVKINYANKIGKTFDFSSWAGYEQNRTSREQSIDRQYIYVDSSTFYSEKSTSSANYKNAYTGLYFEYKPDTLTFIRFNENAGYSVNSYNNGAISQTNLKNGDFLNNSSRKNDNVSTSPSLNGQLSLNHRFNTSKRNIFISINNNLSNSANDLHNLSSNYFFTSNRVTDSLLVNQYQTNNNKNAGIGTSISYSEPMNENSSLNLSYNYYYGKNNNSRNVYDYDLLSSLYDKYNDSLSSHYNNNNINSSIALNYHYGTKKSGFGMGIRWLNSSIESNRVGKDSLYQQKYAGLAPNISFFSNGKRDRFNIYYNFNLQAPQAAQLQPIIDNSNPLYIRLGNPDLKYAMVHLIRYNFNYYNPRKETGYNSNASFSYIINNIASSSISDINTGSQVTKPVNIDGAYNWNAWFSYFSPLSFGKDKLKWNVSLYANGRKNINLTNEKRNVGVNNYTKLYMGITYDTPKWIDLHADFSYSRQTNDYSLQPTLSSTSYFLDISPNITLMPSAKTEINIDYDFRQTTGQAEGFNTSVNMLNTDIVQYLTNKKDIWIKLKAYDILNQNVNVWRSMGDNYIQDTKANVLSRFIMLSLNFKLNKFNTRHEDMNMPDIPQDIL